MAASLKVRHILNYTFDESNARALADSTNENEYVLDTTSDVNFDRVGSTNLRTGHYNSIKRRRFYTVTSPYVSATDVDSYTFETPEDDIGDFKDKVLPDILHKTAGAENSYFLSYSVTSDVAYVSYGTIGAYNITPNTEVADSLTSNIKFITVTVADTENIAGTIKMSAFACNIGSEKTLTSEDLP